MLWLFARGLLGADPLTPSSPSAHTQGGITLSLEEVSSMQISVNLAV